MIAETGVVKRLAGRYSIDCEHLIAAVHDLKCNFLKFEIMTLKDFYKQIPGRNAPKSEWVTMVAEKLEVSEATVRGWVHGRNKPSHPSFYRGLSEVTGIPENELFN